MGKYEKEAERVTDRVMQRDRKRIIKFAKEADEQIERMRKILDDCHGIAVDTNNWELVDRINAEMK